MIQSISKISLSGQEKLPQPIEQHCFQRPPPPQLIGLGRDSNKKKTLIRPFSLSRTQLAEPAGTLIVIVMIVQVMIVQVMMTMMMMMTMTTMMIPSGEDSQAVINVSLTFRHTWNSSACDGSKLVPCQFEHVLGCISFQGPRNIFPENK